MSREEALSELKGNTLRVYWYLLQSSSNLIGPREVHRKLGFSSPSLAVYHLDKLVELGFAEKTGGEYRLTKVVNVGVLKQFTKVGNLIFPRQVLYASMWTTLFAFFLTQFRQYDFYSVFAFIFGALGTGILWFEAWRNWRSMPR